MTLSYDYKLDWHHFESAVSAAGLWAAVAPRVHDHNIASDANQDTALAAQETYWLGAVGLVVTMRSSMRSHFVNAGAKVIERLITAGSAV